MKKIGTNSALEDLQMLEGGWTMKLSNAPFLPNLKAALRGDVSFEWLEGGAFLIMRQGIKGSGMPWAMWLIGRDADAKEYTVLYFDDRNVSRVYQMSFTKNAWKLWRNSPKFSQRFEGKISKDGRTIKARWEKSLNNKKWEHDFDITYTKR
ncbi:MAG: hypothetical protein ACREGH_01075 [Minisyncoccia bacterium]